MIEYENQQSKGKNVQVISTYDKANPQPGGNLVAETGDRQKSPEQSLRDTQQSFLSNNRSDRMMSPSSAMRFRRSREFGGQASVTNYSGWNERHGGSEIRQSRKASELNTLDSDLGIRRSFKREDMAGTGQSWVAQSQKENHANQTASQSFLPDINNPVVGRRPPLGEAPSMKAAGFKRDRGSIGGGAPSGRAAGFTSQA